MWCRRQRIAWIVWLLAGVALGLAPTQGAERTRLAQVAVDRSGPGNIAVEQRPPDVDVIQPLPNVTVRQPPPAVTVEQDEPRVRVDQPAAQIEINTPRPSVEVRQAPPQVSVEQRPPQVEVLHAPPEVRLEGETARVEITSEPPRVVVSQGEPEVVIERAKVPLLPFADVLGRTLRSHAGQRIGVIETVALEIRTDRLFAIVANAVGMKRAVPYPVLSRDGRFVSAPASVFRRYRPENFAPVPDDRVIR